MLEAWTIGFSKRIRVTNHSGVNSSAKASSIVGLHTRGSRHTDPLFLPIQHRSSQVTRITARRLDASYPECNGGHMSTGTHRAIALATGTAVWGTALYTLWKHLPEREKTAHKIGDASFLLGLFLFPLAMDRLGPMWR
jgi:hypothetical protein